MRGFNKNGVISSELFTEFKISDQLYDKTIYKEPDGSSWIKIGHHNDPHTARFSTSASVENASKFLNGLYESEDRWVQANLLNNGKKWELMWVQSATVNTAPSKYRWTQSVNPLTAVYSEVAPGKCSFNTSSGYTSSTMGGLYVTLGKNSYFCIANATNGNWYGALGCCAPYGSGDTLGIPGYPNTTVSTGYIDLYLRINSASDKDSVSIHKDTAITATNFIEY